MKSYSIAPRRLGLNLQILRFVLPLVSYGFARINISSAGSLLQFHIGYIGRCITSSELWYAFEALFQSQSKARAMQLKLQLQTLKKGDSTIDDFLLKMRGFPQANVAYNNSSGNRGRGGYGAKGNKGGRGGGRFSGNQGNKPVCQLFGRLNHVAVKCYKRFDISFTGPDACSNHQANTVSAASTTQFNTVAAASTTQFQGFTSAPQNLESQSSSSSAFTAYQSTSNAPSADCFLDSGATAHVTNDFGNMTIQSTYAGNDVLTVGQNHQQNSAGGFP